MDSTFFSSANMEWERERNDGGEVDRTLVAREVDIHLYFKDNRKKSSNFMKHVCWDVCVCVCNEQILFRKGCVENGLATNIRWHMLDAG